MKYPKSIIKNNFISWQPSTWPKPPDSYNEDFHKILDKIFKESLLNEIQNVINDAPTTEHRGHVIALSILCAIDALSSYAFYDLYAERCLTCGRSDRISPRYKKYIEQFFPESYKLFAEKIYKLYRNSITHSWNLFQAGMLPGEELIYEKNGIIIFGLKNFFDALKKSVKNFLDELSNDYKIQKSVLARYRELRNTAIPA